MTARRRTVRDPAPGREPDPADAGRHAVDHRRLLRGVRVELCVLWQGGEDALVAFIDRWGTIPAELTAAVRAGDWLSRPVLDVFTSMFLHAGWLHLLGNMLYLWIFGNNVEDRMGRVVFLAVLPRRRRGGGRRPDARSTRPPTLPMIGASGAISAVLGAYLVLFPGARIQSLVFLGFFYQLIAVPAVLVLGFWFVLQVLDGIGSLGATASWPATSRSSPTSAGSSPGRCSRCRSGSRPRRHALGAAASVADDARPPPPAPAGRVG